MNCFRKLNHMIKVFTNYIVFAENGEVFGWGNSEYSQLYMATAEQQVNSPVKLNLGEVGKVIDIASGGSMCMVLNGMDHTSNR